MVENGKKENLEEQVQFAAYKQLGDDTTVGKQRAIKEANEMIGILQADIQKYAADAARLAKEIASPTTAVPAASATASPTSAAPAAAPTEPPSTAASTASPTVSPTPAAPRAALTASPTTAAQRQHWQRHQQRQHQRYRR